MIETKLVISICVAVFFFGMLIGLAIMEIVAGDSYKKGKEDEYNRIMSKLEEYQKGDAA